MHGYKGKDGSVVGRKVNRIGGKLCSRDVMMERVP